MEEKNIENNLVIFDYTEYPGPRYCIQGKNSGEDFYHKKLNEAFVNAINHKQKLIVDLDGTAGYASSFLDEAFGNLVFDFSKNLVFNNLIIISNQETDWKDMIMKEVINDWEQRRIEDKTPKKTESHDEWYKLKGEKIEKAKWLL